MAIKIYLAGKISDPARAEWRNHLLTGCPDAYLLERHTRDISNSDLDEIGGPAPHVLAWPQEPNTYVLGQYDYVGPYLIDCRPGAHLGDYEAWQNNAAVYASEHGSQGYGKNGRWNYAMPSEGRIYQQCKAAVQRCDILFAYLDDNDLDGTLIEIGWALAWDKIVHILYDKYVLGDLLLHSGAVAEWGDVVYASDGSVKERLTPLDTMLFWQMDNAVRHCVWRQEQREYERKLEHLRTMPYQTYLQTEHWKAVRADAIERADGRCQLCSATTSLNVHHSTYARRGAELESDVIALCRSCHAKHHDIVGNGQRTR